MNRRTFLGSATLTAIAPAFGDAQRAQQVSTTNTREQWLNWVEKVSEPVLNTLSKR